MRLNDFDSCPVCGNQEMVSMGILGRREWFRCRACGCQTPRIVEWATDFTVFADFVCLMLAGLDRVDLSHKVREDPRVRESVLLAWEDGQTSSATVRMLIDTNSPEIKEGVFDVL